MADNTKIEWADATLNVINGCTVISPGCTNCYAMRSGGRNLPNHPSTGLTATSKAGHVWTGEVRFNERELLKPLSWRKPRRIFWNAHGDMFHENVPDEWIDRCYAVMALTPQHIHMVLTKRPERMRTYLKTRNGMGNSQLCKAINDIPAHLGNRHGALEMPLRNVWLGTSAEDQARADARIPVLLNTPAAVRFVSLEPLLGPVDLTALPYGECVGNVPSYQDALGARIWQPAGTANWPIDPKATINDRTYVDLCLGIDWVIVGGESGKGARPMHPDWVRSLRDQCTVAGVPFHFKQWGEYAPTKHGFGNDVSFAYGSDQPYVAWPDQTISHGTAEEHGGKGHLLNHIGKKVAGRLLDGVEHNGVPA